MLTAQVIGKVAIVMEEWMTLIQEITFPILVTFYLLYRIESKLEAIHTALVSLAKLDVN